MSWLPQPLSRAVTLGAASSPPQSSNCAHPTATLPGPEPSLHPCALAWVTRSPPSALLAVGSLLSCTPRCHQRELKAFAREAPAPGLQALLPGPSPCRQFLSLSGLSSGLPPRGSHSCAEPSPLTAEPCATPCGTFHVTAPPRAGLLFGREASCWPSYT